jgi:hypothetical protein
MEPPLKLVHAASAPFAMRIHMLVPRAAWIGKQRTNPNMKQFVDHIDAKPGADGRFTMHVKVPETLDLVGLWLMAEGVDSGSTFTVAVESLGLIAP